MINWKVRFKNGPFLLSFLTVIVAFVYQLLGLLEIVPKVTQDDTMQFVLLIVNALGAFGIIVDPTTSGTSDSQRAMTYHSPRDDI